MTQYEMAADELQEQLDGGEISLQEYNRAMLELDRGYRDDAEESARNAFNSEIDRW